MPTVPPTPLNEFQKQYALLRGRLADTNWISEGYVQNRGPGAGGPCYQWTRKVKGKTISVALSKEQFQWLEAAIAQWRLVQATLKEMQRLSSLFHKYSDVFIWQTSSLPPRLFLLCRAEYASH